MVRVVKSASPVVVVEQFSLASQEPWICRSQLLPPLLPIPLFVPSAPLLPIRPSELVLIRLYCPIKKKEMTASRTTSIEIYVCMCVHIYYMYAYVYMCMSMCMSMCGRMCGSVCMDMCRRTNSHDNLSNSGSDCLTEK